MPGLDDLLAAYARVTAATRERFGAGASYVDSYDVGPDDADATELTLFGDDGLAPDSGGDGAFDLSRRHMGLGPGQALLIRRFLRGDFAEWSPLNRMAVLRRVRAAFNALIHESVHAIGPADARAMHAEWASAARYAHVPVLTEGVAELAVMRHGTAILRAAGIGDVDPLILDVRPDDGRRYYPDEVRAVRLLLTVAASYTGRRSDVLLGELVQHGCGRQALDRLVADMLQHNAGRAADPWQVATAYMRTARAVEDALVAAVHRPTADAPAPTRSEWARRVMHDLSDAIRGEIAVLNGPTRGTPGRGLAA